MLRLKTLKGCVLSTFSYEETKQLCNKYPSIFSSPWYESWVWREKASADFDITGEFFDLVSLAPSQRYLQLKSYHVLTPDLAVRVHDDGFIEGVYEAHAGYRLAKELDDKEMKAFFAKRLKPEQIKIPNREGRVHMPSRGLDQETIDRLNASKSYKPQPDAKMEKAFLSGLKQGKKNADFFYMVLSSGRTDWIDQILHRYFVLPQGFTIQGNVPYTPFCSDAFPLLHLPLYEGETLDVDYLYQHMFSATDTRVVDFLLSVLGKRRLRDGISIWVMACKERNPEESFGIYKRLGRSKGKPRMPTLVEKVLDKGEGYSQAIIENLGNIPLLLTLLPFVDKRETRRIAEVFAKGHPLTEKILAANLEE